MTVFHVPHGTPYHVENSIRGIRRAARAKNKDGSRKYDEIDLDMLITKDNRVVGCHWPRPMRKDGFRDPLKVIDPDSTVSSLTFKEVHRLVAGRWPRRYRIQPIETLIRECGRRGIGAVLEPKGDKRFDNTAIWNHLAAIADDAGTHIRTYALPENASALPFARAAGLSAKEIR